jgi:predicted phage terminase large subunit-like protein
MRQNWLTVTNDIPWSQFKVVIRGWDLAASSKSHADFTCGVLLGITHNAEVYGLDVWRGKVEWPTARQVIIHTAAEDNAKWPGTQLAIETVSFHLAAWQELMAEPVMMPYVIHPVNRSQKVGGIGGQGGGRDKRSYALPVVTRAEAGHFYVSDAPWTRDYVSEWLAFSGDGKTRDDQVDATSIAYYAASAPETRIRFL